MRKLTLKSKLILTGVLIVIIFVSLVAFRFHERKKQEIELRKIAKRATPVSVQNPKYGSISDIFTTTGTIISSQEVQIIPKVSGRLIRLSVDEGTYVHVGQIIGEIDHSELDAQINQALGQVHTAKANLDLQLNGPLNEQIKQAQSTVKQAEANLNQLKVNEKKLETDFKRYKDMLKQDVISQQQFETSQTQLQVTREQIKAATEQLLNAKSALKLLTDGTRPEQIEIARGQLQQANATIKLYKAQLNNYFIRSPINGVVSKKFLNVGSLVGPSNPIVTVIKNNQLELNMNIPERELSHIYVGQMVDVRTPAYPDKVFKTTIKEISPVVDTQTRLIKVRALIDSTYLKSGMMVDCSIVFSRKNKTLILPMNAIIIENGNPIVYIARGNKVQQKSVKIGLRTTTEVEILEGVTTSDQVIVDGNTFVKPGDTIKIENSVFE